MARDDRRALEPDTDRRPERRRPPVARGDLPRRRGRPIGVSTSTRSAPSSTISPVWSRRSGFATWAAVCPASSASAARCGIGCLRRRARPSCTRSWRSTGLRTSPVHAGRPALPHPRRPRRPVLRARAAAPGRAGRCDHRGRRGAAGSGTSTRATCWASSTAPPTRLAAAADGRDLIGGRGSGLRRRQLRRGAEVPPRPRALERPHQRGAGGDHRAHQGRQRRARRRPEPRRAHRR